MTQNELHETIGRIDANVEHLVQDMHSTKERVDTVEKRQWIGLSGFIVSVALLLPEKWHGFLSLFYI
jgi:hypothetical protein